MKRRMEFEPADWMRLEVQTPPASGVRNLVRNSVPVGPVPVGAWGYVTPVANTVLEVLPGVASLRFRTTANQGTAWWTTERLPLPAGSEGRKIAGRVYVENNNQTAGVRVRLDYFDASGAYLSSSGLSFFAFVTAAYVHHVVPAGARTVELVAFVSDNANGSGLTAGRQVTFTTVAVGVSDSFVTNIDPGAMSQPAWLNILGDVYRLRITRAGLDLGTLTASVINDDLHPAIADTIRPGKRVRVTVKDPATGRWNELMEGTIRDPKVTYDLRAKAGRRARIELTAVDSIGVLANTPRPDGYATVDQLRAVLEGSGVAWNVNGSGSQTLQAAPITTNPQAKALDQVVITRDSQLAYAWTDRRDTLQVYDAAAMPAAVKATLTEADYTDADVDYDTAACINQVTLAHLETDAAGETKEVTYGPYIDQLSQDTWGAYAQTFRVQGLADKAAYAAAILEANATPAVRVNSVTVPIRTTDHLKLATPRALLDLFDLVTVDNTEVGAHTQRVTRIEHTITPKRWDLSLGFARDGGVAAPRATPALAPNAAGEEWIPLELQNGYANYGNGYAPAAYKLLNGVIHVRGLIMGGPAGGAGALIAVIPHPPADGFLIFPAMTANGAARVDVRTDGGLFHMSGDHGGYLSLAALHYPRATS